MEESKHDIVLISTLTYKNEFGHVMTFPMSVATFRDVPNKVLTEVCDLLENCRTVE